MADLKWYLPQLKVVMIYNIFKKLFLHVSIATALQNLIGNKKSQQRIYESTKIQSFIGFYNLFMVRP